MEVRPSPYRPDPSPRRDPAVLAEWADLVVIWLLRAVRTARARWVIAYGRDAVGTVLSSFCWGFVAAGSAAVIALLVEVILIRAGIVR